MKLHELKAKVVEQFAQLDALMLTISDMGDAAHKNGDAHTQDLLEKTYWSLNEARRDVIVALSYINATQGESK